MNGKRRKKTTLCRDYGTERSRRKMRPKVKSKEEEVRRHVCPGKRDDTNW